MFIREETVMKEKEQTALRQMLLGIVMLCREALLV